MFDFFKKKKTANQQTTEATSPDPQTTAPGTQIHYHPDLIENLKQDHQDLVALYVEIKNTFERGDYAQVSEKLVSFRTALQGHLLTENVRLYIYLDHSLGGDETNADLIKGFRREMDGIAKTAVNFLKKYEAIGVDAELAKVFEADFATIGKVLTERIEREENTLYPLYMPSY